VFQSKRSITGNSMAKVAIKQIKSAIRRPGNQKLTLQALGLGKINRTVEKELNPQIQGMIDKVHHLVEVKAL
jgi:large subunit ribosomal protein L30